MFRESQLRYLISIQVVADFDGTLPVSVAGNLKQLWKEVEHRTEEELQNEVAQQISFILCKPCRDAWVSAPLGPALADVPQGQVH